MKNLIPFTISIIAFWMLTHEVIGQCPSDCDASPNNSFVGIGAGDSITTGSSNSFFGFDAGGDNTEGIGNSFFGRSAGAAITTSSYNAFFGNSAGRNNTSGSSNSFFGSEAGQSNTMGSSNSIFGRLAGNTNETGSNNAFFGSSAGRFNLDGNSNAFFGYLAGFDNSTGSFNAFFGRSAGRTNVAGSFNAYFGYEAGENLLGIRNICLGNQAGPVPADSNSSHRLYIDVETSSDPLIYGEFDNDFVRVNGTFEVTAGLMNPSSKTLKTDFLPVNHHSILKKLAALNIEEWVYKDQPGTVHIGPVAEDFYARFGYGSSTEIYTIDADGIALAAIKALYEENVQQQKKLDQLENEIASLKKLLIKNGTLTATPPD